MSADSARATKRLHDPASALGRAAAALGLAVSLAQQDRLLRFLSILERWNAVYNLSALRDPAQMQVLHLFDCLATVEPLRRQVGTLAGKRLLDVGSGAGLPGVVLAIMEPEMQVVCVDAVSKKAAFVRQVAAELGLAKLQSRHARVEGLDERGFDVIASRAFAPLPVFVTATRQLLAMHGVWMAMKGRSPRNEIDALPPDVEVFHVEPLSVPTLRADRCLVWLRPLSATDANVSR